MKKLLLALLISYSYADNTQIFNDAYQLGKQNQATLNLNANSTYTSYAATKGLESDVYNNANAGTQGSQSMTSAAYADKNYLYNKGVQDIQNCQSKNDPRCSTLNKYGDKNTQNQYQAYSTGVNEKYFIRTRPDPSDAMCTFVTTKQPVNATTQTCISAPHDQSSCNGTIQITITSEARQCDPTKGECTQYSSNPNCTMTQDYQPTKCNYICDSSNHKTSNAYCPYWDDVQGGGGGGNFVWGTCKVGTTYYCSGVNQTVTCGTNIGKPSPSWHVDFSNCIEHPAIYQCKFPHYSYNDGCKGK